MKKKRYLLAGSYFARLLYSPMKEIYKKPTDIYIFPHERETPDSFIARFTGLLRASIERQPAKYCVIELQGLLEPLRSGGKLEDEGLLLSLADLIRANFKDGRVVIIGTDLPQEYVAADGSARAIPDSFFVTRAQVDLLRRYENLLCSKVSGIIIDATSRYRYVQRPGYYLNERSYEDTCYADISRILMDYIKEGIMPDCVRTDLSVEDDRTVRDRLWSALRTLRPGPASDSPAAFAQRMADPSLIEEPYYDRFPDGGYHIPVHPTDYNLREAEDTIRKVKELLAEDPGHPESTLCFICVTDIHYLSKNRTSLRTIDIIFERMISNMRYVMDRIPCSFIMNLGDDSDNFVGDFDNLQRVQDYMNRTFLDLNKTYYRAIGNHDYQKEGYSVDVATMGRLYCGHLPSYPDVVFNPKSEGTEYYVDHDDPDVRILVLNTMYNGLFCYSDHTARWLEEEALKTDRLVLLCEHLSPIHTMNMNSSPLVNREGIIRALNAFPGTIIQLCGHSHVDYSFTDGDEEYSPWLTVFTNLNRCSIRRKSDLGDITVGHTDNEFGRPDRKGWTVSEDCWDVVVLRPHLRKINFVRFGAGEDREFSY